MIIKPTIARMAPAKLKLYVDTVSPFAYEAYYILRVRPSLFIGDAAAGKWVGEDDEERGRAELRAEMLMRRIE
jgi:hypothetical protein